jgi:hypothetical protein
VNGKSAPSLAGMPSEGETRVRVGDFFIWPELKVYNRNVAAGSVQGAFVAISMVGEDQIIGKPFKRWFWRRFQP